MVEVLVAAVAALATQACDPGRYGTGVGERGDAVTYSNGAVVEVGELLGWARGGLKSEIHAESSQHS